jgi:hypothetical protein
VGIFIESSVDFVIEGSTVDFIGDSFMVVVVVVFVFTAGVVVVAAGAVVVVSGFVFVVGSAAKVSGLAKAPARGKRVIAAKATAKRDLDMRWFLNASELSTSPVTPLSSR